ncbi:ABC transporter substrate-binding protein [Marinobacter sp. F4206]|uniref:ABC transporter substrate-binding protein n=1 Tax=Marinobacter sp. F4206 TaxID=2861777 RepID=UPI001C5CF0A3|nr:ABC transporter substrate-binding protein [Marinobacter sp. F4206]MBW4935843.1 ABC transporter substrate-binding protein [Marinobacter sp. F4206]
MSIDHLPRITAVLCLCLFTTVTGAKTWQHEQGTLTLGETPKRVVALNWAATEALLLLGVTPVGVADKAGYSVWVREPELPESVPNIGTRVAPSLEAIAELEPDLIVTSSEMAPATDLLERIAPTYVISVYKKGSKPFAKAREMLLTLGEILDREKRAQAILADIDDTLATQRQRLQRHGVADQPVALVNFLDDRHVRIYAPNGLYQTALNALGLTNAWPHAGNYWGFSVVGLEAIAAYPDSRIVVIEPTRPGLSQHLEDSPFWTYLPAVQKDQVYQIDAVWPFGGVFPVKRLAVNLTNSLIDGGTNNVR